ncbi:MAG TPA: hypothetical protein P5514_10135 [Bacteroidales bacterium]|nr:hypothetical protein [Bacteroidales bacterium]HRX97292.1 hypothetical protein [Bacteroidales bacterium]
MTQKAQSVNILREIITYKTAFISLLLLIPIAFIGQESLKKAPVSYSVYIYHPLPYNYGFQKYGAITCNFEIDVNKSMIRKTVYAIGFGKQYLINDPRSNYNAFMASISKIYGSSLHCFEIGGGFSQFYSDLDIFLNLGMRLEPGKRLLIRVIYSPILRTGIFNSSQIFQEISHTASLSIGYRFGHLSRVKGKTN